MTKFFLKLWFFQALVVSFVFSLPFGTLRDAASCQACQPVDPNKINVHLIPHSHDDVGWLKTVDQYYFGSRNDIQNAGVQYIISSIVESLKVDSSRRYIQVESAFFWKWWQHQDDETKQDFVNFVNTGQIEIINAAWSMNDEATTNYHSVIDQFTWGLRTINDTIGECGIPRIGWQIDPFGHSREQASIFAQLGYDGMFFARLDYQDKDQKISERSLELIWKGSSSLENSNLFVNIFPEFYTDPGGFCFDVQCGDRMVTDEQSFEYNIPQKVEEFSERVVQYINYYQTNNLIIPMGGDFHYQSAEVNYIHMDRLINAFKDNDLINVIYSTPSCYIKAVNDEAKARDIEFVQKVDDFLPYGSGPHSYWTGYFSSRPNAKRFERTSNNVLQAAKHLSAIGKINGKDQADELITLIQAVGILQHHDAITGTAKQAVANDYSRLLAKGIRAVEPVIRNVLIDLLKKDPSSEVELNLETCLLSNVSICEPSKAERFIVTVYNPLERPVNFYVRVPVPDGDFSVTGGNGLEEFDVLDSISDFSYIKGIPETPNPKELVFEADVPAFGINLYYVERTASALKPQPDPRLRFGTDEVGFEIDDDSGLLKSVTLNGNTVGVTQQFLQYIGFVGNNSEEVFRASGAYVFRPAEEAIPITDQVLVTSTIGNLVEEVRQQYNDFITQIIRVYKGAFNNYIEFDWLVGPIEIDEDALIGREIVTRFSVDDFNNDGTFYTDSNGRELIKRQLDKRYDYNYDYGTEPVSSNYYPVTSRIVIRDEAKNLEVAVLNDRSQGGSSLANGQIELMVHRRLTVDDGFGVSEALNDTEFEQGVVARGQLQLILGSSQSSSIVVQQRDLALKKLLQPVVLLADAGDLSLEEVQNLLSFKFNGLQATLPENVHILTFEPWKDNTFILRLEHIFEEGEDSNLSESVTVDLSGIFALFEITDIKETTLGANQWLEDYEAKDRFAWNLKGGGEASYKKGSSKSPRAGDLEVTLGPMQIRTFIVEVAKI